MRRLGAASSPDIAPARYGVFRICSLDGGKRARGKIVTLRQKTRVLADSRQSNC